MNPRIVLTGGGSAGHVVLNLALIPRLQEAGWTVAYMGSEAGIERSLLSDFPEVEYLPIPTGKFRRSLNLKALANNMQDVGHVLKGVGHAKKLLAQWKPDLVFSKGGFVSVPVVIGASMNHIPALTHESDMTPGLANKINMRFVKKIYTTFPKTASYLPHGKAEYLGPIIRDSLKGGSREEGLARFGFSGKKPVLVVLGGSLGAQAINKMIEHNLDSLLSDFDMLHGVGKGKRLSVDRPGYVQVEYIRDEMRDVLAMADLIVSRAGSNSIFEFLYYRKPMLLIPYVKGSRGDQVDNAAYFEEKGYGKLLDERIMSSQNFLGSLTNLYEHRQAMVEKQQEFEFRDGLRFLLEDFRKECGK